MKSAFYEIALLFVLTVAFAISTGAQTKLDSCLDKDVRKDDFVVGNSTKTTVREKLITLKARCRKGKLVDSKRREIRFFKTECWGNPPTDYLEIQQRQRLEIARLKRKYTLIEIACPSNVGLQVDLKCFKGHSPML